MGRGSSYQLSTRIILAELQLPTNTRRLRLSVDTATASPVAAIGAATSADHAASSADHARDARIGQQHVGGAQVAAAPVRGHAADGRPRPRCALWRPGRRQRGAGRGRRRRGGPGRWAVAAVTNQAIRISLVVVVAERNELESWRRGKQTGRIEGRTGGTEHGSRARKKKGSPCVIPMPNIYRTISIRQLVVTPGWTVFLLPSTPWVVVSPDTVAFRPFSARPPCKSSWWWSWPQVDAARVPVMLAWASVAVSP